MIIVLKYVTPGCHKITEYHILFYENWGAIHNARFPQAYFHKYARNIVSNLLQEALEGFTYIGNLTYK